MCVHKVPTIFLLSYILFWNYILLIIFLSKYAFLLFNEMAAIIESCYI